MRPRKPWFRTSKNAWYVNFNGSQVRLADGPKNLVSRSKAERALSRLTLETSGEISRSKVLSVAEVCDLFLDFSDQHHEPATYRWYADFLNNFCKRWGKLAATELKPFHVSRWLDAHTAWTDGGRRCAITCIKRALNYAESEGLIAASPIRTVKKPKIQARERVLGNVERNEVFDTIGDKEFRWFVFAMQETGCRPGEVRRVTAGHCDLTQGLWVFDEHKTVKKTGKPRVVYLTEAMVTLCRERIAKYPDGPIFRGPRGKKPFSKNGVRCRFRRLRQKLPHLKHFISYTYRHTYATDALEAGVGIAHVAELLGHSSTDMVMRHYSKLSQKVQHMRDAATQAAKGVARITKPECA